MDNKRHYTTLTKLFACTVLVGLMAIGSANAQTHVVVHGSVFGGGNEATVSGNTEVLMQQNATVKTDVYGGGAFASTGTNGSNTTVVTIEGGTVGDADYGTDGKGNVFGGALGDATHSPDVNGAITVNIGTSTQSSNNVVVKGNIFGCNNAAGTPKDSVRVHIYHTAHTTANAVGSYATMADFKAYVATAAAHDPSAFALQAVYGGGNKADYTPASGKGARVHIHNCDNTVKMVYGGGRAAAVGTSSVNATTSITVDGGRIDTLFAGGDGHTKDGSGNYLAADINGNVSAWVRCGYYSAVFGASNTRGTITGTKTMNIDYSGPCANDDDEFIVSLFGGGNAADISGDVELTIACGAGEFDEVYGGSNLADIYGNVTLTINGGTIGEVYAGSKGRAADPANSITAQAADIYGNTILNIYAGAIGSAYGGSNINGNITGSITVNMDWSQSNCAQKSINNVFGASNLATYRPTTPGNYPAVNIKHGTVTSGVFGAGNGDPNDASKGVVTSNPVVTIGDATNSHCAVVNGNVYGGGNNAAVSGNTTVTYNDNNASSQVANLFGGGNAAGVSGTSTVTLTLGKVTTGVYGGCNSSGTVAGDIAVTINGGTVGASNAHAYGVFGGGYGTSTATGEDVTVTIGNGTSTPTIYGDVYGGSAKGNVNDNANEITKVWLQSGTVYGDIYGGGFGDGGANALVNGKVQVVVDGGAVNTTNGNGGNVFGCNNANGTPKSTVEVTINSTVASSGSGNSKVYALQGVYGGGNLAHYNPTTMNVDYPKVTVNGCASSIKDVYGGGNAAAVPNTNVIINGGDIKRVFAGGNGESGTPAHVGWMNTDVPPTTDSYGTTGNSKVQVKGGTIGQVFGGSNANGVIRGTMTVHVEKDANACAMVINEVYGGGNEAASGVGEVDIVCTGTSSSEYINYVYGGANAADIDGDIELNITGGRINNVFGGNNASGAISGNIVVNVDWSGSSCNDNYLGNVFGGGNLAPYGAANDNKGNYPQVNIKHGTAANVYGGGKGSTAIVYGNPHVNIGDATAAHCAIVTNNVYGGGDEAAVNGNTTVTYNDNNASSQVANLFGGGNAASITGTTTVNMTLGKVTTGIYGGCNSSGNVGGAIAVNINGGTLGVNGTPMTSGIFGGGYGASTTTGGNVTVYFGDLAGTYTPTLYGDIYGGSALGSVNDAAAEQTTVNIYNGTINGNVYGGGLGDAGDATKGKVNGVVNVNISSSSQTIANCHIDLRNASVYGCNNTNGSPQDNVFVNVYKTGYTTDDYDSQTGSLYAIDQVFGGGNLANYLPENGNVNSTKKTTVHIYDCLNTIRRVFAGGNAAAATGVASTIEGGRFDYVFGGGNGEVDPANIGLGGTYMTVEAGIIHKLFGGSNQQGAIAGPSVTHINGENRGQSCAEDIGEFFGGGNAADITGNVVTTIECGTGLIGDIYGGSNLANITGNVTLTIQGGDFDNVFGGSKGRLADNSDLGNPIAAKAANITGNVTLNLEGGEIDNAFGGCNINGNITGTITVKVDSNRDDCPLTVYYVYGGGKDASYTPTDATISSPTVNLVNGSVQNDVFGGGLGSTAGVTANPHVNVGGSTTGNNKFRVLGNVYGGGSAAPVTGSTTIVVNSSDGHPTTIGRSTDALVPPAVPTGHGDIFGGGLGATAIVSGNTSVGVFGNRTIVYHNVYGGGSAGVVQGSTDVQIGTTAEFGIATPVITIDGSGNATITCSTPGVSIHYNVGNSPADPTDVNGTVYSGAVAVPAGQTIKAVAYRAGYTTSAVASAKRE